MTSLRDRLAAATHAIQDGLGRLPARPEALIVSRIGVDWQDTKLLRRWPGSGLAGFCQGVGAADACLHGGLVGEVPALLLEWLAFDSAMPASDEAFAVWLAARLDIPRVIHVCAGTALDDTPVGESVVVRDHVRWNLDDPLVGWASAREGARFPQLHDAYDLGLRRAAHPIEPPAREVVVLGRRGPSGPTPAETEAFTRLGAQIVVEGGCTEALAARHAGLPFAALVLVLERAGETPDPGRLAERAFQGLPRLGALLHALLRHERPARTERDQEAS